MIANTLFAPPAALALWWQRKTPREQRVLAWGALLLAMLLLYALAWLPLARERARLHAALPTLRGETAQLQRLSAALQGARTTLLPTPSATSVAAVELPARIAAAIQNAALSTKPPDVKIDSPQRATLTVREAQAARTLTWAASLPQTLGWRVVSMESVVHPALPGVIDIVAVLQPIAPRSN